MSQVSAGWFQDPFGRFELRYWDGQMWTAHVSTAGQTTVDPPVPNSAFAAPSVSVTEPATAPATESAPESVSTPASGVRFLDSMAPDSRDRPRPSLRSAVAGLGGLVLAGGQFALIAGTNPTRAKVIIAGAVALACAYVLRLGVKVVEVGSAAVGMAAVAIPVLGSAITVSSGRGQFITGALIAALYLATWAAPGFRGRNLFLALGLLGLLEAFGSISSNDPSSDGLSSGTFQRVTNTIGTQGVIYLIGAALFLGVAWTLDRRAYHGTATALCGAGLFAALLGTGLFVSRLNSDSGPVLVTLVGVVVCIVGAHGQRRATTWWGAVMVAIGVTAFVLIQWKPTGATESGTALLVAGAVLVAAPLIGSRFRAQ
jgi:hypothetical protein